MSDQSPIARETAAPLTVSELSIVDFYARIGPGADELARADAKVLSSHTIAMAIAAAKDDGTYWLPEDLGNLVLRGAAPEDSFLRQVIENLCDALPAKRADGMTDEDFTAFWNTTEIERRMHLLAMDEPNRVMHIDSRGEGPVAYTRQLQILMAFTFGRYGHPSAEADDRSPHRPLPYEIQNRVADTVDVSNWDFGDLRQRITGAGSLNAYYRSTVTVESDFNFG